MLAVWMVKVQDQQEQDDADLMMILDKLQISE